MKLQMPGTSTSKAEVTNIDVHGLWMLVEGTEYFLPYEQFPWFRNARVNEILNVQLLHASHLHWPDLDIDLSVESLLHPEDYPLVYRAG